MEDEFIKCKKCGFDTKLKYIPDNPILKEKFPYECYARYSKIGNKNNLILGCAFEDIANEKIRKKIEQEIWKENKKI